MTRRSERSAPWMNATTNVGSATSSLSSASSTSSPSFSLTLSPSEPSVLDPVHPANVASTSRLFPVQQMGTLIQYCKEREEGRQNWVQHKKEATWRLNRPTSPPLWNLLGSPSRFVVDGNSVEMRFIILCVHDVNTYLVYEFAENGSLSDIVRINNVPSAVDTIPTDTLVVVPVNCSCFSAASICNYTRDVYFGLFNASMTYSQISFLGMTKTLNIP